MFLSPEFWRPIESDGADETRHKFDNNNDQRGHNKSFKAEIPYE